RYPVELCSSGTMKRQRESCHLRKLAKYTRTFAELGCSLEAKDVHGNTPVHLILYHCLQTGKFSFADRLLSDLLGCQRPGRRAELLRLCNSAGVSCQRLLDRLADQEAATSAAADAALTADIDERDADNSETIIWQRRLADAAADDADDDNDGAGFFQDEGEAFWTFETLDDWFDRIGREYASVGSVSGSSVRLRQSFRSSRHLGQRQWCNTVETGRHAIGRPECEAYLRYKDSYLAFFQSKSRRRSALAAVFDRLCVGPEAALRWLRLAVGGDAEGLVAELRQLRVLWHPDKFMQKFGDRLPAGRPVREAVLSRVTLASQLANGAAALLAG
uniref:ANK_REP_REGION domain-containing protein n=1 Tax=Macrostomum lignano TaxID=282301 RepID=A0A1I8FNN7_9PLAT